jgi:hypothetical protein
MARSRANVRRLMIASLATLTALGALTLTAGSAMAAAQTRYVAIGGSDGSGDSVNDCTVPTAACATIQHAVDEADPGDTVSVGAGPYPETVSIGKSLTVIGSTTGTTAITGNGDVSIDIEPGGNSGPPTVTLQHLSAVHNPDGPGIIAFGSNVTITDSVASDDLDAGLVFVGGELTVANSTFDHNTISADGFGTGTGALVVFASATFESSTFAGNESAGITLLGGPALQSPGVKAAVQIDATTTVDVRNSTASGNGAGGVVNYAGALTADDSTFAGNVGGGIVALGGASTITNSTVTGTKPFPGDGAPGSDQGGILALAPLDTVAESLSRTQKASLNQLVTQHQSAVRRAARALPAAAPSIPDTVVTVSGSIVAKNTSLPDCVGDVTDKGYNLSSDAHNTCTFSAAKHDLVKTEPKLGPLADNGGATRTELLLKGSPAIDAIATGKAGCITGATDQRGIARPQPAGGACDMGAVELAAKPIVIHPNSLPHGTVGESYSATLTATGGAYPTYAWSLAPGSALPPGLALSAHGVISGKPSKAGSFSFTVSVNDPVLKHYTIVIDDATGPNGSGNEPIANTGTNVLPLSTLGGGAILAGLILLLAAGLVGRRPGRHRAG